MTRYSPQWLDSPAAYSSAADRTLLRSLLPTTGVRGMTPTVLANTMQLSFGAGAAAVQPDSLTTVHMATDGLAESITLATGSASGQSRIDTVVARYRASDADWIWAVNQGTATTGTPVAPGPTAGTDAGICNVTVPGGVAFITQANVADIRATLMAAQPADSGWTTISLSGGASGGPLQARKMGNRVRLRGGITVPTLNTTIATLPLSFAPTTQLVLPIKSGVNTNPQYAVGVINTSGQLIAEGGTSGTVYEFSGMSWETD